jgi:hypothetical protein
VRSGETWFVLVSDMSVEPGSYWSRWLSIDVFRVPRFCAGEFGFPHIRVIRGDVPVDAEIGR